jgi:iron complex outermembrane receptor protein
MNFKVPFLRIFSALLFMVYSTVAFSQFCIIKGRITDQDTKKPVPFVNIGLKNTPVGTTSDIDGDYEFQVLKGNYILVFSSIEYEKYQKNITITEKDKAIIVDVVLKPEVHTLNGVVVSSAKFDQKTEESVNSVDIIKPKLIESKSSESLDKIVEQVPGVAIVDNEPQFRGGSGYSSGLGSRVMILIDEMPILRADAQRPVWNFLPVEIVDQIEVLKGASSVLFGSSALNGAINIRTKYPKAEPETKAELHSGIYSVPQNRYKKVWDGFNPYTMGFSISHARAIKNFDLVVGGNVLSDQGYLATPPHNPDTPSQNTAEFNKQYRINFNTRFRSRFVENLTYGVNGNFMKSKSSETYIWFDSDSNIYRAYPGAYTEFNDFLFYVDPYIKYYSPKGTSHTLKNRVFYANSSATNNQSSRATMIFNEYQVQHKFKKAGNLLMTAGLMNTYSISFSEIFSGVVGQEGTKSSENAAIYLQLEKKFFNKLSLLAGGRFEYFNVDSYTESRPVFRAGINYQLLKGTFIRVSYGEGFRFPSIAERYIATFAGNFGIYPNPELQAETSQSYELGIKQLFKFGRFVGMLDLAGFWQEYQNYIEFNAQLWGDHNDVTKDLGYKFLNTGRARVRGAEISLMGDGYITKNIQLTVLTGYTYSLPQAVNPHEVYYSDPKLPYVTFNYVSTSSDTTNNILKYRMQHLAKFDAEVTRKGIFVGFTANYYGFMQNIDQLFYNFDRPGFFPTGIVKYRKEHNNGDIVLSARAGVNLWNHFKFSLIVNNLLNTEYSIRPLKAEAPRTISIQVSYKG